MNRHKLARLTLALVALAVVATPLALRGPLNPPAGPVASTYKTLSEVEPRIAVNATNTPGDADSLFKITQPGSYYLTGNVTGVAGKHGIEIAASGVTIDLNGFDLLGVGAGAFSGVFALSNISSIDIRNGSCRNWGDGGINCSISGTGGTTRIESVRCTGNLGNGITIIRGTISGCTSDANGGLGFRTGSGSTITGCSAFGNVAGGFNASSGSVVAQCSAYTNSGYGITVFNGGTVVDCNVRSNDLDGIVASTQCTVRANACSSNGFNGDGAGIHVTGADNRIEENNCSGADRGIDVDGAGNFIARNTCSGNTVNWVVVANNKCLIVVGANAAAINGDSGGISPGSTDPNANFTY